VVWASPSERSAESYCFPASTRLTCCWLEIGVSLAPHTTRCRQSRQSAAPVRLKKRAALLPFAAIAATDALSPQLQTGSSQKTRISWSSMTVAQRNPPSSRLFIKQLNSVQRKPIFGIRIIESEVPLAALLQSSLNAACSEPHWTRFCNTKTRPAHNLLFSANRTGYAQRIRLRSQQTSQCRLLSSCAAVAAQQTCFCSPLF
jgi:hypothetical protein